MTGIRLAIVAVAATVPLAGCGSSGGGGTGTGTTSAHRLQSSGLKVDTTPRFAAPSSSAPVLSGHVAIAYRNIAIDPDTLRVKVGSTIEWTNYDEVAHNVTSEGGPQRFASKDIGPGRTFAVKVVRPGTIHYECTVHPTTMNGTVEAVG